MTLRQARILSSETDNTIKQEQNTNVNIKITPQNKQSQLPSTVPMYPNVDPLNPHINFTQASPPTDTAQDGPITDSPQTTHQRLDTSSGMTMSGVYPFPPPIDKRFQEFHEYQTTNDNTSPNH